MNNFKYRVLVQAGTWIRSWFDIIDSICWIVTLGFWSPQIGIRLMIWESAQLLNLRIRWEKEWKQMKR